MLFPATVYLKYTVPDQSILFTSCFFFFFKVYKHFKGNFLKSHIRIQSWQETKAVFCDRQKAVARELSMMDTVKLDTDTAHTRMYMCINIDSYVYTFVFREVP